MKKLLTSLIAVVMLLACSLTLFVGCQDPIDYEHTIIFYSTQSDALQQQTNIAIANFEAKFPGWTVLHQQPGGYDDVRDKIVGDLQNGQQPDLAYCYADHVARYIPSEKVVDMHKFIKSTETIDGVDSEGKEAKYTLGYNETEIADFVPGYYEEGFATNFGGYKTAGYADDAMLTLPFSKSTELMYYNKDALAKVGLKPATTWDELWAQEAKLSEEFPTATLLGYDSEANWFITMCEQNGWGYTSANSDNHFLFNGKDQIDWLDSLRTLYTAGTITTQELNGGYTSSLFTKGVNGGCIYCIGSSGGASHQKPADPDKGGFNWGIAPIPGSVRNKGETSEYVDYSVISQGPSVCMFYNDNVLEENQELKAKMTFLFLKELLDPTFQATFSQESGYNPVRISTNTIPAYVKHMNSGSITAEAAKVSSTLTEFFFTSPAFKNSSLARDQVGAALQLVIGGSKSGTEALRDAYYNCGGK
ncbi:MAG: extracellular solute-binding protein [Corallococcus sp.]|nr:extracellular solute-binding protein [Corallococcus sp.]